MVEYTSLYLFLAVCLLLMLGYPVAFTLAGTRWLLRQGGSSPAISIPASWRRCRGESTAP